MFQAVVARFRKVFLPSMPSPTPDRIVEIRRKLFRSCPACGKSLEAHSSWRLASVILAENSETAEHLTSLIAARDWKQAALIQEWEGGKDEREYHLVRCPSTEKLSLVTVCSTAEMWSDDYIEATSILDEQDSKALAALAGDRWESF